MTSDRRSRFLTAILGEDGARALTKAAERSAELGQALVPRTILAWLNTVRGDFEGELPGVGNTYARFAKSEKGYTGSISIGDELYKFEGADVFKMVAAVAVALDLDQQRGAAGLRVPELEQLGKSIDVLAKAKMLTRELAKAENKKCEHCGKQIDYWHPKVGPKKVARFCSKCAEEADKKIEELEKATEAPGPAHTPTAAASPAAPVKIQAPAPAPKPRITKPKGPKPPKPVASYTLKLSQSETKRPCPMCGQPQFKDQAFKGCMCLRDLAKSAKMLSFGDEGATLELSGQDWDEDAVATLLDTVGRR